MDTYVSKSVRKYPKAPNGSEDFELNIRVRVIINLFSNGQICVQKCPNVSKCVQMFRAEY